VSAEPATDATIELLELDSSLELIAAQRGKGAGAARSRLLAELFARSTQAEQDFLRRLIVGELRQGAQQGVMEGAIAKAFDLPLDLVRRAAMLEGELPRVAELARTEGAAGLGASRVQLLRPLSPMLADAATDVAHALKILGEAVFEYKLDGVRVQVHKQDDEVRVFTRNLNEVSARVPELTSWVRGLGVKSAILDGELLLLRADGRPEPFQITMQRFGKQSPPTKDDVAARRNELKPFFFDLIQADGEDYIDRPLNERTAALAGLVPQAQRVEQMVTADLELAQDFFEQALKAGHEGVIAKAKQGTYDAGRRGSFWLKVKPAHTLDLVVLAAEWGSGRRQGSLSNLHLGARDPESGGWVMLGKTFKGMTDELLIWQTKALLERQVRREGHIVFVRPELVVEVAFDGVQRSRQYPGGVALRFARVRGYRPDKSPEQADTISAVRALSQFEA
jgi:DNA ligase-1